jgi:tetratricopeptide (TPR) repeat protein
MPRYLATFVETGGAARTERVEASSRSDARRQLEERGCAGIVFFDDETSAALREETGWGGALQRFTNTPEEELKFRAKPTPATQIRTTARALFAVMLLLVVVSLGSPPLRWYDFVALLFLALFTLGLIGGEAIVVFDRLQRAQHWARWDEVLRGVTVLHRFNRLLRLRVLRDQLDFMEAAALAALGRTHEWRTRVQQLAARDMDPSMRWVRLSTVYYCAGDRAESMRCLRRAFEQSTENSSAHIDLALGIIRIERDPKAARDALASRRARDASPPERIFIAFCEGLIALEEGKAEQAADLLELTLTMIADMHDFTTWGSLELTVKAYACIACAESGRSERARALLDEVTLYLQAHEEQELLERCLAAAAAGRAG